MVCPKGFQRCYRFNDFPYRNKGAKEIALPIEFYPECGTRKAGDFCTEPLINKGTSIFGVTEDARFQFVPMHKFILKRSF